MFAFFDRCLPKYQNLYPPAKYYYIIEKVYFIYRLFTLFLSIFSFLQFLYLVSWKYKYFVR